MKFTFREFRQLADLPNVRIRLPQAADFTPAMWEQASSPDAKRVLQWLRVEQERGVDAADDRLTVNLWFNVAPTAFVGEQTLQEVRVRPTGGDAFAIRAGIAVTCVGYACRPIAGAPGYDVAAAICHRAGQVLAEDGHDEAGLFVAGWAKRGPTGIIGTNRACGYETAATLAAALPALMDAAPTLSSDFGALLDARGIVRLGHADWQRLDAHEKERGAALGKPREKLLSLDEAFHVLSSGRALAPESAP